jgi:hypothetical protein
VKRDDGSRSSNVFLQTVMEIVLEVATLACTYVRWKNGEPRWPGSTNEEKSPLCTCYLDVLVGHWITSCSVVISTHTKP